MQVHVSYRGEFCLPAAGAEGVTLKAMYGAFAEHAVYYIVEAESVEAVNRFLMPGFKRCTARITPVSEEPIA